MMQPEREVRLPASQWMRLTLTGALEGNFLTLNVMHSQAKVSTLLVLIAVYAGAAVGGVIGASVAIPLVAALRVLVLRVIAPAIRSMNSDIDVKPVDGRQWVYGSRARRTAAITSSLSGMRCASSGALKGMIPASIVTRTTGPSRYQIA